MTRPILRVAISAMRVLPFLSLFAAATQAIPSQYAEMSLEERTAQTYSGCYSSSNPLSEVGTYLYQSTGYCGNECTDKNAAVLGLTGGNDCWCGNELPAASAKVDDSFCNVNCTGWGVVMCGGNGFWSVYLTGLNDNVGSSGESSSSSTSTSTGASSTSTTSTSTTQSTQQAAIVTSVAPGTTVIVTQPADHATSTPEAKATSHSSTNTAGIVAGVVVGIVAFAAIIGGVYYYLRYRQRRQAQEDYQRNNQVQQFMRQTSNPSHGPTFSNASDQRLDPFAGRRNSVGSLADNQDYSRRILRVANPDGRP